MTTRAEIRREEHVFIEESAHSLYLDKDHVDAAIAELLQKDDEERPGEEVILQVENGLNIAESLKHIDLSLRAIADSLESLADR